jgi:hypothetical protein
MDDVRGLTLATADAVQALLGDPQVAAVWDKASALPRLSVRGLAGHIASQVFSIELVLAERDDSGPVLSVAEHYGKAARIGADLDAAVNVAVRDSGERLACGTPAQLAAEVAAAAARLRVVLAAEPTDRVVRIPWTGWRLRLDDFLLTRMVEMVVHGDDLVASAAVAPPPIPVAATELVLGLLMRLAVRRHGPAAVLRAFTRPERADASITAI